jgi:hypothetical protein
MLDFFSNKKTYGGKWQVVSSREFTPEEQAKVARAAVVSSEYGMSCCFFMKNGNIHFTPMSNDSTVTVGEDIDLSKAEILTLSKEGENNIERIKV